MGTVPSLRTWTAGEIVTAAYMNANVRDASNFMIGEPIAELFQAVAQSIPNAAFTTISFDSSLVDSDSGHSNVTNNSRYTAKTPGWFEFSGGCSFSASAVAARGAQWLKNGTAIPASSMFLPAGTNTVTITIPARTKKIQLNGSTDFVELQGYQNSGGALNTSVAASDGANMTVKWIHS